MKTQLENVTAIENFEDVELTKGKYKVIWEYIDEGVSGDFNNDDANDVPLLRFTCYKKVNKRSDWEQMDDASYCTRMPVGSDRKQLKEGARVIMEAVMDGNYKRRLEELSWMCPCDFKKDA